MELPERAVDVGTTTRWLADAVVEMGGCGDVEAVLGAAVRRTREAFDADAVAVVLGGEVVSRSGALGDGELARAVVEPRPDAAVAPVASALAGHLVVVRAGTPFTAADVDLIGVGAFSPLEGFLTRPDYDSVVERMRLANGLPWSIPIMGSRTCTSQAT